MSQIGKPRQVIFEQNSHTLFLLGLLDQTAGEPGTYVNTATVTGYIQDEDGNDVHANQGSPFTLAPLGALVAVVLTIEDRQFTFPDGNYSYVVPESVSWAQDAELKFLAHKAFVDADAGTNRDGHWEIDINVDVRRV